MASLITGLDSLSPLSFSHLKAGDTLILKKQQPKKTEFRGSIGKGVESILVFRGQMKVGMLPIKFTRDHLTNISGKLQCKVLEVNPESKQIKVEIAINS